MFQSLIVISVQFSKLNHSLTISILFTALKEDTLEIVTSQGIRIKRREMALVWHEKASCSALQTSPLSHTHTLAFGTDTQHDYSQGNCRTMSSIMIKLE